MARMTVNNTIRTINPDYKLFQEAGMLSRDMTVTNGAAAATLPVGTLVTISDAGVVTPILPGAGTYASAAPTDRIGVMLEQLSLAASGTGTARILIGGTVFTLGLVHWGGYELGTDFTQVILETAGAKSGIRFILEKDYATSL